MPALDGAENQVMTVCKVALADLAVWTVGRFLSDRYAHAIWDGIVSKRFPKGRVASRGPSTTAGSPATFLAAAWNAYGQ